MSLPHRPFTRLAQMARITLLTLAAAAALDGSSARAADDPLPGLDARRWTVQRADAWYAKQPWLCGFNYIPATAINSTEMWAADTFDATRIDRELAEAQKVGFNCARVFVQYIVYEQDPAGLHRRMGQFLDVAARRGIRVMLVPFDDCYFGPQGGEPIVGRQPAPIPNVYAGGFTSSPGQRRVMDPRYWPQLQAYVTDLLTWYKDDPRVFCWDLYNEVGNSGYGRGSYPLLRAEFEWARQVNPSQPLTTCYWADHDDELNRFIFDHVDVVTFHNYGNGASLRKEIDMLKARGGGRPVICTEWMNRPEGSLVAENLPVFMQTDVAAINWGLVNGKTQTNLHFASKPSKVWQHDLFHTDLTPYDPAELGAFHHAIEKMNDGRKGH